MDYREKAKQMIDGLPNTQVEKVLFFMQGLELENKAGYLNMLERSRQEYQAGKVIIKTMDELEAMANE